MLWVRRVRAPLKGRARTFLRRRESAPALVTEATGLIAQDLGPHRVTAESAGVAECVDILLTRLLRHANPPDTHSGASRVLFAVCHPGNSPKYPTAPWPLLSKRFGARSWLILTEQLWTTFSDLFQSCTGTRGRKYKCNHKWREFSNPPSSKHWFPRSRRGCPHHSLRRADEPLARSSPSNLKAAHAV